MNLNTETTRAPISPPSTQTANILIDGATGYIGSHLVYALKQMGLTDLTVRCLVRKGASSADTNFLQTSGAQIFQADLMENEKSLDESFAGIDVACHLIGSIAPHRGETSHFLHIKQTEYFVQHCLKAKVKKVIMVSACGATREAKSEYHRTKWQAQQIIRESGLPAIILRPSLLAGRVVGQRNSKLIARLQNLIANKKVVPLIGGGTNKVQPLFISDLIEAIITCIFTQEATTNENTLLMELGGPEVLTLRDLTQHLMKIMNIRRPIFDLPVPVAQAAACIAELVQEVPIISRDQIILAQQDNICSNNQLVSLIEHNPTTLDQALNSYMSTYTYK